MQWIPVEKDDTNRFDLLIAELQLHLISNSSLFESLKQGLLDEALKLKSYTHLRDVAIKEEVIDTILSDSYWTDVTLKTLEDVRLALRDRLV